MEKLNINDFYILGKDGDGDLRQCVLVQGRDDFFIPDNFLAKPPIPGFTWVGLCDELKISYIVNTELDIPFISLKRLSAELKKQSEKRGMPIPDILGEFNIAKARLKKIHRNIEASFVAY